MTYPFAASTQAHLTLLLAGSLAALTGCSGGTVSAPYSSHVFVAALPGDQALVSGAEDPKDGGVWTIDSDLQPTSSGSFPGPTFLSGLAAGPDGSALFLGAMTSLATSEEASGALAMRTPSGDVAWTVSAPGWFVLSAAVDADASSYVAIECDGEKQHPPVPFAGLSLACDRLITVHVVKLDATGHPVWTLETDVGSSIALAPDGVIGVIGEGNAPSIDGVHVPLEEVAFASINPDGSFAFAKNLGPVNGFAVAALVAADATGFTTVTAQPFMSEGGTVTRWGRDGTAAWSVPISGGFFTNIGEDASGNTFVADLGASSYGSESADTDRLTVAEIDPSGSVSDVLDVESTDVAHPSFWQFQLVPYPNMTVTTDGHALIATPGPGATSLNDVPWRIHSVP
jgi:hypothetical protein